MIATLFIALLAASSSTVPVTEQPALQCNIGPALKQFGCNEWLIYGCADGHSVVVAARAPNPAAPFVFILTPDGNGGIELHGEGAGTESATKPAYDSLNKMSSSDWPRFFRRLVVPMGGRLTGALAGKAGFQHRQQAADRRARWGTGGDCGAMPRPRSLIA